MNSDISEVKSVESEISHISLIIIHIQRLLKSLTGHNECFQKDGVHPDAAGAKLIANEIFRMLSVK